MSFCCSECGSKDMKYDPLIFPIRNQVRLRSGEIRELTSHKIGYHCCIECGTISAVVDKPTLILLVGESKHRVKSIYQPTTKRVYNGAGSSSTVVFLEDFNNLQEESDAEALKMLHPQVNSAMVRLLIQDLFEKDSWRKEQHISIDVPSWG